MPAVRIFLAGGTGVIGIRLIPLLRDAGHHVAGMTRSAQRADGCATPAPSPWCATSTTARRCATP